MKGIMFTFTIAIISYILAKFPILHTIGALAIAIIFAMIYRQVIGYPEHIRPGITFASKRLLKFAIILYGLKLNMGDILGKGWKLLLIDIIVIIFSISLTLLLNQIIKGNKDISILLGIGTGVCGAAAIAATAPILKSKEKDIAISVGIIALVGTIFALIYTAIEAIFNIPTITYGAWTGVSLHEIAHVVLAADIGGPEAMTFALLGKLGRVFLLIPLSIVLILYMRYKSPLKSSTTKNRYSLLSNWIYYNGLYQYICSYSFITYEYYKCYYNVMYVNGDGCSRIEYRFKRSYFKST